MGRLLTEGPLLLMFLFLKKCSFFLLTLLALTGASRLDWRLWLSVTAPT